MMKRFFTVFVLAAVAIMAAFSCTKEEGTPLVVSISADAAFTDGAATVKVYLMEPAASEVSVNISAVATPSEGYSAIDAADLEFNQSVKIPAGSKESQQVVRLRDSFKPAAEGKYEAVLSLYGASGAKVSEKSNTVHIAVGGSYSGDGSGPNPTLPGFMKDWKVSYEGYTQVQFNEGASMCEVFKISGTGSHYFYVRLENAGTFASISADVATLKAQAEAWLADDLNYYSAYQWTIDDLVVCEDPHYEYFDGLEEGSYEVMVFGMTKEGTATGEYTYATVVIDETHGEGGGGGGEDDESYIYDVIAVNGTGSAYFYFDIFSPGSITSETLQVSMLALAQMCNEDYQANVEFFGEDSVDRTDFMNDADYNYYEFDELELGATYDILIVGLSADGNLTGEYNISSVQIDGHQYEGGWDYGYESLPRKLAASRHQARRSVSKRDFQPTITGTITQMEAWQAEYLGRYEDAGGYFAPALKKRLVRKIHS